MKRNSRYHAEMPEGNSTPVDRHRGGAPSAVDEQSARTFRGLRNLAERITPWLVDVGSWVFGGLIAVNLVVISALVTVGPIDEAIRTSTAALAAALPLNVAGIVLLRLIKDINDVGLDDLTLREFQDAAFPDIDAVLSFASREISSARETLAHRACLFPRDRGVKRRVDRDGDGRSHVAHGPLDRIRTSLRGHSECSPRHGRHCSRATARL